MEQDPLHDPPSNSGSGLDAAKPILRSGAILTISTLNCVGGQVMEIVPNMKRPKAPQKFNSSGEVWRIRGA
jgi:hypothetical protein